MADANGNAVSMTEKQKVKEITDRLEEGLKELFESGKYKSYLSTMSKFHNYSFNNTLLIAMQNPEATLVAGYQAWQKNFNRHVNKGEKGIRILAPAPYKIKEERDKIDPVTGEIMLDQDGMPQKEEVEIKIPAFRAVTVFDISQTDGEPIPELKTKELLFKVEGYEDFIKAIAYVAPAPINFEDIPGDSKGYFSMEENRIAVQEGMSESQTLKTMVHETAHSMLHNQEVDREDILAPAKDRNTKEVEAESIAYTVCQHFGIDTSEYSFGYIAGWSSGKDMKELKSSLDTIRRTASELIMGIEEQLKELQHEKEVSLSREMMQDLSINGQEKGSLLLIQNSDLSEYSLVNVRGMDAAEVVEALSAMNENDRRNVAAYLESRGAWTTEIAHEETSEFGENHIDVRYYTDTNEIIDRKAGMTWEERAKEPSGTDDVIPDIKHFNGFEAERIASKTPEEEQLLYGTADKYGIYQLKDNPELRDFHFAGTTELLKRGILSDDFREIRPGNYNLVYTGELSGLYGQSQQEKLNAVFEKFNIDHPADYKGHSLSVSDIVVLHENGENSAHFVDSFWFTELPDFIRGLEGIKEQETEKAEPEEMQDISTPDGDLRVDMNVRGAETEQAQMEQSEVQKNYPAVYGHTLSYAVEHGEVQEYKASRTLDRECKEAIEETIRQNFDGMYLKHDIVKPLTEQYGSERIAFVLANMLRQEAWDGRFSKNNKAWASEFPIPENIVHETDMNSELVVSSHPAVLDGFIDMFRSEVLEQKKEWLTGQEKVVSGHDVQKSKAEQSGTEQTEPEKSVTAPEFEGMDDEDEIIDLGDEKDQVLAEMKKSLAEDKETEPAFPTADRLLHIQEVGGGYDGSVMDEDDPEGAREAGEKERISIFDIRMNDEERWFKNISGLDAEELCKAYAECGRPFVEMGKYGERIGAADYAYIQQGEKLDFSVEFNEETDQITIFDGENFAYKGLGETLFLEQAKLEVTLTVAECGEFHNLGEFYENIPTVDEAVAIWKQISPERMNGIPAIGINIHTPGTEAFEDVGIDILSGKRIDLDILEYIPDIKGSPQAMEVIAELVAKVLPLTPEMEIDGSMSEEFEAKVWEKRMPALTPAEQLAVEIDRFTYDYNTYFYRDNIQSMTQNVSEISEMIVQGDIKHLTEWLDEVICGGAVPDDEKRAKELLERLAEYKPPAKVEDNAINGMEEQKHNMVDNVLNNGAGEKARKEENKKEQERPAAKTSLKARLAGKKALVFGQGKDHEAQENIKNSQREI